MDNRKKNRRKNKTGQSPSLTKGEKPEDRQNEGHGEHRGPGGRRIWVFFWIFVILFAITIMSPFGKKLVTSQAPMTFNEFLNLVAEGQIQRAEIRGRTMICTQREGAEKGKEEFKVYLAPVVEKYIAENMKYFNDQIPELITRKSSDFLSNLLFGTLPWLFLLLLVWFFFFRQMRAPGGAGGVLSFGKSRAKLASKDRTGITFNDVAGIHEAKEDVKEIIEFLKDPKRFQRLGGRIPRGVMLIGPPGTGKTLLAKAIAGEAEVPFFSICGSDFVEMFVGVGASRVRDLFKQARENSPCIIFLDEIDAVGRRRGSGLGGGHDEREQTLNAILVEMDGFERDEGIILIAATNRPDVLDPALLRPGRFDREIVIDLPDIKGREEILAVHARDKRLKQGIDMRILARGTPGCSGADLEAVLNEAAIQATMEGKDVIEMEDLEEARDKTMWGRQKRSKVMDSDTRNIIAFHESGHALIAKYHPKVEPLHKVTIMPRGVALGSTMSLPEKDRYLMSKKEVLGNITELLAGRVSEEMFCNDVTSGAQNDFQSATEMARLMVCKWGMSEEVGTINYSDSEEHLFLGREITRTKAHSEVMAVKIDEEVRKIIDLCYKDAREMLEDHKEEVKRTAEALLKYESLNAAQVDKVAAGEPLDEGKPKNKKTSSKPVAHGETDESEEDEGLAPAPAPQPS